MALQPKIKWHHFDDFYSLAASEVVKMKNCGAGSDRNVFTMTPFLFYWHVIMMLHWLHTMQSVQCAARMLPVALSNRTHSSLEGHWVSEKEYSQLWESSICCLLQWDGIPRTAASYWRNRNMPSDLYSLREDARWRMAPLLWRIQGGEVYSNVLGHSWPP